MVVISDCFKIIYLDCIGFYFISCGIVNEIYYVI